MWRQMPCGWTDASQSASYAPTLHVVWPNAPFGCFIIHPSKAEVEHFTTLGAVALTVICKFHTGCLSETCLGVLAC